MSQTRAAGGAGVLLGLCILLNLSPSLASAHSEPVETSPPPGARLASSPTEVSAVFSEELASASTLTISDPTGAVVAGGADTLDLTDLDHLTLTVEAALADGSYTATWVAVSALDGDTTSGSWMFVVGDGPLSAATVVTPAHGLATDAGDRSELPVVLGALTLGLVVVWGGSRRVRRTQPRPKVNA